MKKILYLVVAFAAVCSCASNEDKANKLIKDYMFKHLHDFKSYEVVETNVDSLYNTPVSDPECVKYAIDALEHIEKEREFNNDAEYDEKTMDIWSGGWSSASRKEYDKAYKSWLGHKVDSFNEQIIYLNDAKSIVDKAATLDGKTHIGWFVTHSFRSNNLGGNSSLGSQVFLIDKGFKNIISTYDSDDNFGEAMDCIASILTTFETPEQLDTIITGWKDVKKKYEDRMNK